MSNAESNSFYGMIETVEHRTDVDGSFDVAYVQEGLSLVPVTVPQSEEYFPGELGHVTKIGTKSIDGSDGTIYFLDRNID